METTLAADEKTNQNDAIATLAYDCGWFAPIVYRANDDAEVLGGFIERIQDTKESIVLNQFGQVVMVPIERVIHDYDSW